MSDQGFVGRWVGLGLTLVGAVASLWLTATGKLTYYIHPRYTVLTVVMATLAVAAVVAAIVVLSGRQPDHHHDDAPDHAGSPMHGDTAETGTRSGRLRTGLRALVLICAAIALLVLPPATLTATTRQSRDLVTSGQSLDATDTTVLAGGNPATFSVKDWASLLRQGGADAVLGKQIDVSGYVLDQGQDDTFYVVRLLLTCCAVDAQPIGVPVYQPGWRKQLKPSDWVAVKGTFVDSADAAGDVPVVVRPTLVKAIDEPAQPYVF